MSIETEKASIVLEHVEADSSEMLSISKYKENTLAMPEQASSLNVIDEDFENKYCTDIANGNRFALRFGAMVKHSHSHGWLVYDGKRWKRDPKGAHALAQQLPAIVRSEFQSLGGGAHESGEALKRYENRVKALRRHAKYSGSSKGIDSALREARVKPQVMAEGIEFDADPYQLNCQNGTLNLQTGELQAHRREDHITKLCPVEFDSNAKCPRWQQFLQEVFNGNQDLIDYIQWYVGYSLTGSVKHHLLAILHGDGRNGKGVFIHTIADLLGEDYAQELNPEEILAQQNARHATGLAALKGTRFLSVSETDQGRQLNESLVKKLTGGDKIRARFMRMDEFEFYPQFKLFLATNYRPTIKDNSVGMWDRIRLIPFEQTFDQQKRDPELKNKLRSEWKGILSWAVQGAMSCESEPPIPSIVKQVTEEYRDESDVIRAFFAECICEEDIHAMLPKSELYDAYKHFTNGRCESSAMFNKALVMRGCQEARTGKARCWKGLALVPK